MERWSPVPFDVLRNYYEISDHGRVRSRGNRILKTGLHTFGYPFVVMQAEGVKKLEKIHRMVAIVYVPNPNNLPCVNHIDFNVANPYYKNLEWVTKKGNTQHSRQAGRFKSDGRKSNVISWDKVDMIFALRKERMTMDKIADLVGCSRPTVSLVLAGKIWKRPQQGFDNTSRQDA